MTPAAGKTEFSAAKGIAAAIRDIKFLRAADADRKLRHFVLHASDTRCSVSGGRVTV